LLEAEWDVRQAQQMFGVPIRVSVRDERGALAAVTAAITEAHANIESVDMQDAHRGEGSVQIGFRLQVENTQHLMNVLTQVRAQPAVVRAVRGA